jgi:hypothetical protein
MFSARVGVGVGVRVCCLALSSIVFSTTLCSAQSASPASDLIGRWIDPQTFQLLTRYHYVDPATPTPVANQMQTFEQLRFRVKADPAGRVAVGFGYSSGSTFIGSWNDTGIGTGTTRLHVGLRLLWLDVTPVKGVTAQVGSLQIVRGESTEFTTFDNDGYMVGERISVRRPKSFFFDEVSVTRGFLGDANKPSVFDRTERFGDFNYQQYLLARHFATHVWASADLTRWNHVDITHAAVRAQLPPELRLIDGVRYEQYVRAAGGTVGTVAGFTVSGEKKILSPLLVSLGYGDIDKNYGSLNADRFNRGRRLFGIATYTLSPVLALSTFVGRAVHNDYLVSNHTRVDVTLTYNVLAQLQRAGVLH